MNNQTETNRFENSPIWAAKKDEAKHRQTLAASASMEASDDWLDDVEEEEA